MIATTLRTRGMLVQVIVFGFVSINILLLGVTYNNSNGLEGGLGFLGFLAFLLSIHFLLNFWAFCDKSSTIDSYFFSTFSFFVMLAVLALTYSKGSYGAIHAMHHPALVDMTFLSTIMLPLNWVHKIYVLSKGKKIKELELRIKALEQNQETRLRNLDGEYRDKNIRLEKDYAIKLANKLGKMPVLITPLEEYNIISQILSVYIPHVKMKDILELDARYTFEINFMLRAVNGGKSLQACYSTLGAIPYVRGRIREWNSAYKETVRVSRNIRALYASGELHKKAVASCLFDIAFEILDQYEYFLYLHLFKMSKAGIALDYLNNRELNAIREIKRILSISTTTRDDKHLKLFEVVSMKTKPLNIDIIEKK